MNKITNPKIAKKLAIFFNRHLTTSRSRFDYDFEWYLNNRHNLIYKTLDSEIIAAILYLDQGTILAIAVDYDHRKQGYASKLLSECLDDLRSKSCKMVTAYTNDLLGSYEFLEKKGFDSMQFPGSKFQEYTLKLSMINETPKQKGNIMSAKKIDDKPVKAGRMILVENQNRHGAANPEYVSIWVEDPKGNNERCLLFTKNEIRQAEKRASRNPEDLTKKSWISNLID